MIKNSEKCSWNVSGYVFHGHDIGVSVNLHARSILDVGSLLGVDSSFQLKLKFDIQIINAKLH